jgi:hypothetical protein
MPRIGLEAIFVVVIYKLIVLKQLASYSEVSKASFGWFDAILS